MRTLLAGLLVAIIVATAAYVGYEVGVYREWAYCVQLAQRLGASYAQGVDICTLDRY